MQLEHIMTFPILQASVTESDTSSPQSFFFNYHQHSPVVRLQTEQLLSTYI